MDLLLFHNKIQMIRNLFFAFEIMHFSSAICIEVWTKNCTVSVLYCVALIKLTVWWIRTLYKSIRAIVQFWLTYFAYLCLLFMFWTDHTTIRASFCACIRIEIHSKCIVARNVKVFICMIFDENSNFYKLYFNVKYECRHCLTKANL